MTTVTVNGQQYSDDGAVAKDMQSGGFRTYLLEMLSNAMVEMNGVWCGTATGTANAVVLTPATANTVYVAGQVFRFKASASPNSAATTVAVSGLAAIAVQTGGAALVGGEILANQWYQLLIDASLTSAQLTPINSAGAYAALAGSASQTFSVAAATAAAHAVRADQTYSENILLNSAFFINQEAPATNADDTYAHDGWYALTQTGTIALSTLSDAENTTPKMARLTQSQASAQRMGYAQIVEGKKCKHLRGQSVTFRFNRVRLSASANIRYAVIEWTGTEDVVTSDIVLAWTSGTYTAGAFFTTTSTTVSGVTQQALTANTLTTGSDVTVTLGSSFNNLIFFVWTEATVAQNVTLDVAKAQGGAAIASQIYRSPDYDVELNNCKKHYQKCGAGLTGTWTAATDVDLWFIAPVELRATPTAALLTTTPSVTEVGVANRTGTASAITSSTLTTKGFAMIRVNGFTSATAGKFAFASTSDMFSLSARL